MKKDKEINKSKSNEKRMHHFVAKLLLKNFSVNDKFIYIYDHFRNKYYHDGLDTAFAERDLNTLYDKEGKPEYNIMEDLFDEAFEKETAISIRKILDYLNNKEQEFNSTITDYTNIFRFAVFTHLRTPYAREKAKHGVLMGVYGQWYVDQFLKHGCFQNDILEEGKIFFEVEKGITFSYLENFDEIINTQLNDLKLTILYHNFNDEFFLIPDQGAIVFTTTFGHLAASDLKLYLPLSSNVMFCYERINRPEKTVIMELNRDCVRHQNKFVMQNFYDFIGCQNKEYLQKFIVENGDYLKPQKKFNSHKMVDDINSIKKEIIEKLSNTDTTKSIQCHINEQNEFKILWVNYDPTI